MLCNLDCLKARLRLLCNELSTASSLNLVSRHLNLRNIFISEWRIKYDLHHNTQVELLFSSDLNMTCVQLKNEKL